MEGICCSSMSSSSSSASSSPLSTASASSSSSPSSGYSSESSSEDKDSVSSSSSCASSEPGSLPSSSCAVASVSSSDGAEISSYEEDSELKDPSFGIDLEGSSSSSLSGGVAGSGALPLVSRVVGGSFDVDPEAKTLGEVGFFSWLAPPSPFRISANADFFAPAAGLNPALPPLNAPKPPLAGALTAAGLPTGVVEIGEKADWPNADWPKDGLPNTDLPSGVPAGEPKGEEVAAFVGVAGPKADVEGEGELALKKGESLLGVVAPNAPKPDPSLLNAVGVVCRLPNAPPVAPGLLLLKADAVPKALKAFLTGVDGGPSAGVACVAAGNAWGVSGVAGVGASGAGAGF